MKQLWALFFDRVAEIILADDVDQAAARRRYVKWRDLGANLHTHRIAH